MISPRGLTMSKVTHMRQALHQICADEAVPTTTTALILAEHDLHGSDVMLACDVLEDVVADFRQRENDAMRGTSTGITLAPMPEPIARGSGPYNAASIAANKQAALSRLPTLEVGDAAKDAGAAEP